MSKAKKRDQTDVAEAAVSVSPARPVQKEKKRRVGSTCSDDAGSEGDDSSDGNEDAKDSPSMARAPSAIEELTPERVEKRQRQIDIGKSTPEYAAYLTVVPRSKRIPRLHPVTPNKNQHCSKRSWDGQVRKWRRLLHQFDTPEKAAAAVAAATTSASQKSPSPQRVINLEADFPPLK